MFWRFICYFLCIFATLFKFMNVFYYIQTLTSARAANVIRTAWSYCLSSIGIYKFRHYPSFISIEPANYCMLHCPQCPVGIKSTEERKLLDIKTFSSILEKTQKYVHTMIFHFQGEPLLNSQLSEMIRLARQYKIYTMLSTNGLLMTENLANRLIESGLSHIIISIDGITQTSYETYRKGGKLEDAISAVKLLSEMKKLHKTHYPIIEVQCLMLKSNEHEWDEIKREYRQWGADKLTMKSAQFYNYEQGDPLMPSNEKYSRYRRNSDGTYSRKKAYHNRCYRLWSGAVIDVDGNLLPCCFDKDRNFSFGNITKNSLDEIVHSVKAEEFRKRVMRQRKAIDICRNCTE